VLSKLSLSAPSRFLSAEGLQQIGENGNITDVKSLALKALDVSECAFQQCEKM
jgi:hypothetical protein